MPRTPETIHSIPGSAGGTLSLLCGPHGPHRYPPWHITCCAEGGANVVFLVTSRQAAQFEFGESVYDFIVYIFYVIVSKIVHIKFPYWLFKFFEIERYVPVK